MKKDLGSTQGTARILLFLRQSEGDGIPGVGEQTGLDTPVVLAVNDGY